MNRVVSVPDVQALQVLAHPLRLRILEQLRTANSAATVARALDQSRQNVNYHIKELERVALVRQVGERRRGNFVESLYEAVGRAFVVSPRLIWGEGQRAKALAGQISLERLVELGEQVQRDAAELLDAAAFDGKKVASASVDAELRFADDVERAQFMNEYLAAVGPLLAKYGSGQGEPYQLVLAVYPSTTD